jgi:hypothetical protein
MTPQEELALLTRKICAPMFITKMQRLKAEIDLMKGPEGYEKDDIKKHLDGYVIGRHECWYFCPYMSGFGKTGVSDIVGCYRGKFFCIEVKREGKEPTPIQYRRMAEVEAAGGKAFWGTASKVIPEFEVWIR